jgi:hypothetical protein
MVALGQVSLAVQYIDGTKIESVANKYTFVWKKATLTNKTKLEEKIKSVLKQIDEGIAQDNAPSKEVCADSGYGSEQNYEFMENNGIEAYVKYNWFHKEQHHPFRNNPFRMENMYYNWKDDYYVCPMGQYMEHVEYKKSVSDNGYALWIETYRAQRCEGSQLRGQCFKGKGNRTINVNHMAFNLQKLIKNVGKDQIKAVMEAFSALFGLLLASLWTLWGKFQKEETSVNKNRQLSNRNLIAA